MTRPPLPPVSALLLTSALALAACGGGGGGAPSANTGGPAMKNCRDGSTVLQTAACPEDEGNNTDDGDSGTDGDTGTGETTGGGSPSGGGGDETTTGDGTGTGTGTTGTTTGTTPVRLASLCTSTSCRGVFWSGTAGTLDRNAVTRSSADPYDHDRDPTTPDVTPTPYRFQASYSVSEDDFPADDPMTDEVNELDDFINALNDAIALIEQDVRYAQYTVDAVVDLVGRIRTGREGEELVGESTWFASAEIRSLIMQNRAGAPVSAFSATLPLTEINPVAQIIAARGVSHDLRGAADEDVASVETLLSMTAEYERRAMAARDAINARLTRARADVGRLRASIATQESRATSKESEIATAASEANRLRGELSGTDVNNTGLEGEWRTLSGFFIGGAIPASWEGDNRPSPNCNSEATCRTRFEALGRLGSDGTTIVGGLVGAKRMELTGKQGDLAALRAQLAAINAEAARLRAVVQPNGQLLSDLEAAASEIAHYLRLIAAAESAVMAQQTADEAALGGLPDDIESTKAAAIRTALEGIVNAPGATDPARARFARDGNLADLDEAAGNPVFARRPAPATDTTLYADYGMWLTGTDAAPVLETRMGLVDPDGAAPGSGDLTTPGSATYNGTAHGLSARTATSGGDSTTASGHFTAAVRLNATFGDNPEIGGTVTNFRGVSGQGTAHVGSGWTIDLRPTGPRAGTGDILNAPFDNVGTDGNPTDGGWSAYAYGAAGERPVGVYGGFQADFADGAAIGQFDAR